MAIIHPITGAEIDKTKTKTVAPLSAGRMLVRFAYMDGSTSYVVMEPIPPDVNQMVAHPTYRATHIEESEVPALLMREAVVRGEENEQAKDLRGRH